MATTALELAALLRGLLATSRKLPCPFPSITDRSLDTALPTTTFFRPSPLKSPEPMHSAVFPPVGTGDIATYRGAFAQPQLLLA